MILPSMCARVYVNKSAWKLQKEITLSRYASVGTRAASLVETKIKPDILKRISTFTAMMDVS